MGTTPESDVYGPLWSTRTDTRYNRSPILMALIIVYYFSAGLAAELNTSEDLLSLASENRTHKVKICLNKIFWLKVAVTNTFTTNI